MKPEINLITIWTDDIPTMRRFYGTVLGFKIKSDLGEYVEFESSNVRFSLCKRTVMKEESPEFIKPRSGQSFELAFPCENEKDVDESYRHLVENGAGVVQPPKNMPWNQRTALFKDPDGNIHELFCDLT